jgi:hypothetical protein
MRDSLPEGKERPTCYAALATDGFLKLCDSTVSDDLLTKAEEVASNKQNAIAVFSKVLKRKCLSHDRKRFQYYVRGAFERELCTWAEQHIFRALGKQHRVVDSVVLQNEATGIQPPHTVARIKNRVVLDDKSTKRAPLPLFSLSRERVGELKP